VVFVVSTSGQGDTPGTMRALWRSLLRRSLPPGCLAGLNFAIAALGDSGYALFCAAARRARARLVQLGATEAVET
jgi:sulfite reductase alpha subunit-like flavoprotein